MKALEIVQEIADEIGGRVREDYSGRCMYGRQCVGIVCEPYLIDDIKKEAKVRGLGRASQDSMGLQAIVYWSHLNKDSEVEAPEYDEDEEDEEDDDDE